MYNTYEAGNMPFYGKVYGTGNVVLDGGNNAMTVDASLTTGSQYQLHLYNRSDHGSSEQPVLLLL